jgi:hypothetical protein
MKDKLAYNQLKALKLLQTQKKLQEARACIVKLVQEPYTILKRSRVELFMGRYCQSLNSCLKGL